MEKGRSEWIFNNISTTRGKFSQNEMFNYFATSEFTYRVREMSSQLFVTLFTLYLSLCGQTAETTSPEPFLWIPQYIKLKLRIV